MLVPSIVLLLAVTIYPTVFSFFNSLFSWNFTRPQYGRIFVGLGNYIKAVSDPLMLGAARNTVVLVIVSVLVELVLGFCIALLLETELKGFRIIRTILLLPMMITPVIAALMWLLMYNTDYGVLRYFCQTLGLQAPLWLADKRWALWSVACVDIWQWTPFVVLMVLAGLHSIPRESYEAAKVDGANYWQKLTSVTLPWLRPVLLIVILMRVMDTFKFFDPVYVLTKGGPGNSTETLSFFAYRQGFRFFEIGYGAAVSILIVIAIGIISQFLIKQLTAQDENL